MRLTVNGELAISCLLMEIMNAASIGPRLLLAPAAQPGDGLLDLVYLEAAAPACDAVLAGGARWRAAAQDATGPQL